MDIAQLGYEIDSSQITAATKALDDMNKAAGRAQTGTDKMTKQMGKDLSEINGHMRAVTSGFMTLVKGFVSFQAVKQITELADTWSNLTSQVRLSIAPHENVRDVMKQLASIARTTYSSLEATAESFSRNSFVLKALGKSTQDQLNYTSALNNALVVSGAKGHAFEIVQNGMSRAMAEGTLKAQELDLMMNYASRTAELLAEEMGVNVTQLRGLASEGKITGEVIYNALVKNMEKLAAEAESMPATIGDAFILIKNSVLAAVGAFDQNSNASGMLAEKLILIADAIDLVVPPILQLMEQWAQVDETQKDVAVSAMDIAYAMKAVVTGLLIAKNTIDVLIDGFVFAIKAGGAMAEAMVKTFEQSGKSIERMADAMRNPFDSLTLTGAVLQNAKDAEGIVAEALAKITTHAENFNVNLQKNVGDVTTAFEFLKDPIGEVDRLLGDLAKSAAGNGGGVKLTAEQIKQLGEYTQKTAQMLRDAGIAAIVDDAARAAAEHAAALQDEAAAAKAAGIAHGAIAQRLKAMDAAFKVSSKSIKSTEQALNDYMKDLKTRYEVAIRLSTLSAKQSSIEEAGIRAVADAQEHLLKILDPAERAAMEDTIRGLAEAGQEELDATTEAATKLEDILSRFDDIGMGKLVSEIKTVELALEEAFANKAPAEEIARLKASLGELNHQANTEMIGSMQAGLQSMQSMASGGSKAFKLLQVAMDALSLATAISAIVNQGLGDPYTAFARIAAMAALMAKLVGSIGAVSGGFSNASADRQESQGTGTVLGDMDADSESIANGVEITAEATSELVGINRGMLSALRAMQAGIGGAAAGLARTEFGDVSLNQGAFSELGINPIGGLSMGARILDSIFGGEQELVDQGILIVGGTLQSMIDNIMASAYQTIETDGGWFGSDDMDDELQALSEAASNQLQLVLQSLSDAVREAAEALGMDMDEVNAAIEAFRIEEIRISTMDLSAEEAQAELEAVFSAIFDDLAGSIVPFIAQFQQVGEGLGETLIRVATSVQVAQEAFRQLGLTVGDLDPETMAQVSVGLVEAVGSLEEFISGMQSFVANFAPESHQFAIAQDELTRAFDQFGLTLPATREAMWELMQTLDPTTESGREHIAMLIRLNGAADTYYDQLEQNADDAAEALEDTAEALQEMIDATRAYQNFVSGIADEIAGFDLTQYQAAIRSINTQRDEEIATLQRLARAAGLSEAAEQDLAAVHVLAARRAAQAMAQLQQQAMDLVEQLYGTEVDQIDERIAAIESATQVQLDGIDEVGNAAAEMWDAQMSALQSIREWMDSQLLGDLSTLTPVERLAEARRQFEATAAAARGGDVDALARLPEIADALLREQRDTFASHGSSELEAFVRGVMGEFARLDIGLRPEDGGGGGGSGQVNSELRALYEERDQLLAEQTAAERVALAQQLTTLIRDWITATGKPLVDIAASLNLAMDELIGDLGINLEELTVLTASSLADVAESMGINLAELADTVEIELGSLADAQSLMNDALEEEIAGLPQEQRDLLAPLLEAIEMAADTAGVESGIDAMESAINAMAPALRDQLAPYFEGVGAVDYTQLDALSFIDQHTLRAADTLDAHTDILERIASGRSTGLEKGLPSFDVGTSFVPSTGPAMLHQGEMVWPSSVSDFFRREGIPMGGNSSELVAEVRALRSDVRRVEDAVRKVDVTAEKGSREVASEVRNAARPGAFGR